MEELAQSLGNEKIPGEFDRVGATVVDPNANDVGPFQHLVDSNPALGREEALSLLSQKIAQLPPMPKRVLAMLYHEHMPLSEIAVHIGMTESLVRQIHGQTVALLRNYAWGASKPVSACFSQEFDLVVLHPRRSTSAKK